VLRINEVSKPMKQQYVY